LVIVASVMSLLAVPLVPVLLVRFHKRKLAAFHRSITNGITIRFADRLPGFGILRHAGRKSGKVYRTPVNVFRTPDGFLIALAYGRESEWVKNVMAAGGCQLETRGVWSHLSAPTIVQFHRFTGRPQATSYFWSLPCFSRDYSIGGSMPIDPQPNSIVATTSPRPGSPWQAAQLFRKIVAPAKK
jgi:deazaflavin-dependent oxidoreductase (nitroreductase family)